MRHIETIVPGTITLADLDAMPDHGMRYELVDAVHPFPVRIIPAELVL